LDWRRCSADGSRSSRWSEARRHPFPVTTLKPIPGYVLTRTVARALVRYYRLRDRLEAA